MADTTPVIVWFRQDLRLADNPALSAACDSGHPIVPVFILDDDSAEPWAHGGASRWWLHYSLQALNQKLKGSLVVRKGRADPVLDQLVRETGAAGVYWNRCYEPWRTKRDADIKSSLKERGLDIRTFNAALLHEPWTVLKDDGTPYRVFTPFWKACLSRGDPGAPLPPPRTLNLYAKPSGDVRVDDIGLLPAVRWDKKMEPHWTPGEDGGSGALNNFLENAVGRYKEERDYPAKPSISRLSPHLHFGEVSPRQIWHTAGPEAAPYLRQLIWREFTHHLLFHNPDLPDHPLQKKFAAFPWQKDDVSLRRWQRGLTGYPLVDAGMRELWETGWMHNRVRMVVGSFLVKHLLIDWRDGQRWFWDCLVDADLAQNSFNWQWIAGCGADAAPYFRIFNPITQSQKFDPAGVYIKRWIPELSNLSSDDIHTPWTSPDKPPPTVYPEPIIDHFEARDRALAALQSLS